MWVISEDHGIRLADYLVLLPCRVTWKGIESSNSGKFERVFSVSVRFVRLGRSPWSCVKWPESGRIESRVVEL